MQYYVYILTTQTNSAIYVGVTNNLQRRLYEHQNKLVDGFTKRYNINKLVYFETCEDVNSAILREKTVKHWSRDKKNRVITEFNPTWNDLTDLVNL